MIGIKKFIKKLLQFQGFKYTHLLTSQESGSSQERGASQEQEQEIIPPISNKNCHFLIFGSSGSGKTSFLKHYLTQIIRKSDYLVFGRGSTEFHEQNFIPLLQLEKIGIETLANKTVILDDAGA